MAGMNNLCHVLEHSVDGLDNPQSLIRFGTDFIPLLGRCFVVSLWHSGLLRERMKNNAHTLNKEKPQNSPNKYTFALQTTRGYS